MHRERWKLCRKLRFFFYFVKLCFNKKLKAEAGSYLFHPRRSHNNNLLVFKLAEHVSAISLPILRSARLWFAACGIEQRPSHRTHSPCRRTARLRPTDNNLGTLHHMLQITILPSWGWAKKCPKHVQLIWYFADRASQYIYLNINQLAALNFIMSLFQASTCFEHTCSSSGGQNCTVQPLVSSHLQVWW